MNCQLLQNTSNTISHELLQRKTIPSHAAASEGRLHKDKRRALQVPSLESAEVLSARYRRNQDKLPGESSD